MKIDNLRVNKLIDFIYLYVFSKLTVCRMFCLSRWQQYSIASLLSPDGIVFAGLATDSGGGGIFQRHFKHVHCTLDVLAILPIEWFSFCIEGDIHYIGKLFAFLKCNRLLKLYRVSSHS